MVTGCGGIQTWRTAYPRPALGSIGWGLFSACGSSPKGIDSREPKVPRGVIREGPRGVGRTPRAGDCGFGVLKPGVVDCAAAGLAAPTASRSAVATTRIRMQRVYLTKGPDLQ